MTDAPSLNEINMTLRKATLGAGWPLGHATDIGDAAAWLCANGRDGVAAALAAIRAEQTPQQADRTESGWVLRGAPVVLSGPSALDLALACPGPVTVYLDTGFEAFLGLAGVASQQTGRRITLGGAITATLLAGTPEGAATITPDTDHVVVVMSSCDRRGTPATGRHAPRAGDWTEAKRLAARTLVPDSEQSRTRGAGAGGIDSD